MGESPISNQFLVGDMLLSTYGEYLNQVPIYAVKKHHCAKKNSLVHAFWILHSCLLYIAVAASSFPFAHLF